MTTKSKPAHVVKLGLVEAAIWQNSPDGKPRYSVTVKRSYATEDKANGKRTWSTTESFGRDDLLTLAKAVDLAHTWICEQVGAKPPTEPAV